MSHPHDVAAWGCHAPSHAPAHRAPHAPLHAPTHAPPWYGDPAGCWRDWADDGSVAWSCDGSPDELGLPKRGGRAARARARAADKQKWQPGQWLGVASDITIRGEVVCAKGAFVQIVLLPEDRPDRVRITMADASNHGATRELLVAVAKLERLPYKVEQRQEQLEQQGKAKAWRAAHANPDRHWRDWMDPLPKSGSRQGSRQVSEDDEADGERIPFTAVKTGQRICAGSAEQAAKKAWRVDKKQKEIVLLDANGQQHTFFSSQWATEMKEGVRGGGPKFQAGKRNKRQAGMVRVASFADD